MTAPQPLHPAAFDALAVALDRVVELTGSMGRKVIDTDPRWEDLPSLLTDDELRIFYAWVLR